MSKAEVPQRVAVGTKSGAFSFASGAANAATVISIVCTVFGVIAGAESWTAFAIVLGIVSVFAQVALKYHTDEKEKMLAADVDGLTHDAQTAKGAIQVHEATIGQMKIARAVDHATIARMQKRLEPRTISRELADSFKATIRPFSGTPVQIYASGGTPEVVHLSNRIAQMLFEAGWHSFQSAVTPSFPSTDILIARRHNDNRADDARYGHLSMALHGLKLGARDVNIETANAALAGMQSGTFFNDPATFVLVIGPKGDREDTDNFGKWPERTRRQRRAAKPFSPYLPNSPDDVVNPLF